MDVAWFATRLEAHAASLDSLIEGLDEEAAHRRPAADAWSIVEILNHLADEEAEDFRPRLESTLADPSVRWTGIDPPAWVADRRYQERDLRTSRQRFQAERQASLAWLNGLEGADWSRAYEHPLLGRITAADLLLSWYSHDLLHFRQMGKRLYELGTERGAPGRPDYAGPW